MTDIVNGLLLRNGHVLLARRAFDRRNYPATWSFPGGHIEQGEMPEDALRRELMEEIGISPISMSFLLCLKDSANTGECHVTFHLFSVTVWEGEPTNLGSEHSELRWMSLSAASNLSDLALAGYKDVFTALVESDI